jgi:hypothetical protein
MVETGKMGGSFLVMLDDEWICWIWWMGSGIMIIGKKMGIKSVRLMKSDYT